MRTSGPICAFATVIAVGLLLLRQGVARAEAPVAAGEAVGALGPAVVPPPAAATAGRPGAPLSLAAAEAQALRNQPVLRQAEANVDISRARIEQARSAYFPQLTGAALYQRTTGNFVPRPGAALSNPNVRGWSDRSYDFFSVGVVASQLIYDFGQTTGRWRAARATSDAVSARAEVDRAHTLGEVRRAYFQLRALQELVTVASETLANQQRHLTQIEGLVGAGLRPGIDRARALTDLENARVQLVRSEGEARTAQAVLAQALGAERDQLFLPTDADFPPVPGENEAPEALLATALRARPELHEIARARVAEEATLRATRGAYGPSLLATGSIYDAGREVGNLVPNWSVGLTLAWPFFQGGLTTGQVHEAQATLRALAAQEDTLRLAVRVEVDQASFALRTARGSRSAAEAAAAAARDQLRLAESRYATGLGNAIELSDAQLAVTQAQAQEVGTRYALAQARAQLSTALGRP